MSTTERADRSVVVTLMGEIDVSNAEQIDAYTRGALRAQEPRLVFDLSAVTFMDSKGLDALMRASKAFRASGGEVTLRAPSAPVELLLDTAGIDRSLLPVGQ